MADLVDVKIKNFLQEYYSSTIIFVNEEVKNNLLHPGEFGTYRENLLKPLLEFVLPKRYSVGSGFIINTNQEVTTQCDVIIYDLYNSPFITGEEGERFFQQEVVYGIGEMKSSLTKANLAKALIKLSKNKKIRRDFNGLDMLGNRVEVRPEKNIYDNIFSFLICEKITDFDNNIGEYLRTEYEKNNIDIWDRHNIILSLKNGVITYKTNDYANLLLKSQHSWLLPSPFFGRKEKYELEDYISYGNDNENLKQFLIHINNYIKNAKSYYPEPRQYLE